MQQLSAVRNKAFFIHFFFFFKNLKLILKKREKNSLEITLSNETFNLRIFYVFKGKSHHSFFWGERKTYARLLGKNFNKNKKNML